MKRVIKNGVSGPGARAILIGLAAALMASPVPSAAWTAMNSQRVYGLSATSFEVVGRSGSTNTDYWCAAGDYARRVLDVPVSQRIYIQSGLAAAETQDRKSAVQFTLQPPADADLRPGFLVSIRRVGENMSMSGAWSYCLQRTIEEE